MSRFTRHNPAAVWQFYRCHLRCMRRALAGALLLLLLIAAALTCRQTHASYSGRDSWGSAFEPALRVFSVADTWHAQAAQAQLPPPPPQEAAPPANAPPPANDSPTPAPAPSPVSHATEAFAAMVRTDLSPQTDIADAPKLLPALIPNTTLPELRLPEPAQPAPLTDLLPAEPEAPEAQPDTGRAPGTPRKRPSTQRTNATTARSSSRAGTTAATATLPTSSAASSASKAQAVAPRGSESAPIVAARYRSAPPPPYPASLRAQRISGSVGVLISINAEGDPTDVSITRSSGHPEFDTTARRWILKRWRFHPATRDGVPQPSQVRTSVRFLLD